MNKVTRLYQDLIDEIKDNGCRVIHCNRMARTGRFRPKAKLILINNSLRDTLLGCYTLAHELGHLHDYLNWKFPEHHHLGTFHGKEMPIPYVRRLEWSAIQFGKKILEDKGFDLSNQNIWWKKQFNKKEFENLLDTDWLPHYNGTRIGKKYEETETYKRRLAAKKKGKK